MTSTSNIPGIDPNTNAAFTTLYRGQSADPDDRVPFVTCGECGRELRAWYGNLRAHARSHKAEAEQLKEIDTELLEPRVFVIAHSYDIGCGCNEDDPYSQEDIQLSDLDHDDGGAYVWECPRCLTVHHFDGADVSDAW